MEALLQHSGGEQSLSLSYDTMGHPEPVCPTAGRGNPAANMWESSARSCRGGAGKAMTASSNASTFRNDWEFLGHRDGVQGNTGQESFPTPDANTTGGRFGQGFHRRQYASIRQDETRHNREHAQEGASAVHLTRRRGRLEAIDKQNGCVAVPYRAVPHRRAWPDAAAAAAAAQERAPSSSPRRSHAPLAPPGST